MAGCPFPGKSKIPSHREGGSSLPARMVIHRDTKSVSQLCQPLVPSSPRGVTESCTGRVLTPMALMAWHSYCPWSCRATRPTRRVPVDRTLCRRSLGKGPPGRTSSSLIPWDSPRPTGAKVGFAFVRSSCLSAALQAGVVGLYSSLTPALLLSGRQIPEGQF